jgi:O-antigen ligase
MFRSNSQVTPADPYYPSRISRTTCFSLAMLGLAWTIPFLQPYHSPPLTGFYSEWLAFVFGVAALAFLFQRAAWEDMRVPTTALFLAAFVPLILLQWALGRILYGGQALLACMYFIWASALIVLASALRREIGLEKLTGALAWCLLAGGLLSAGAAILQHYGIHTIFDAVIVSSAGGGIIGNLGQPNHFGCYDAMALMSLAYLYARGKLHWMIATAIALPLLYVGALSGSRAMWLYIVALPLLAGWLHSRSKSDGSRKLIIFTLSLAIGFLIAQWIGTLPFFHHTATTSGQRLVAESQVSSSRLEHWRAAWWAFKEAPVLGAGWGRFPWHHFLYQAQHADLILEELFNHTHNILFQLLAETGLAGTALLIAGAFLWISRIRSADYPLESWWLLGLLTVIGLYSMVEFPLWYSFFLGLAAVAVGMGAGTGNFMRLGGHVRRPFIVVCVFAFCVTFSVLYSYRDLGRLYRDDRTPLPWTQAEQILERGMRDPIFAPYAEFAASSFIALDRENLGDKLVLNTRVMHFAPVAPVVYRQAILLGLDGQKEAARRQFTLAMRAYPHALPPVVTTLESLRAAYPGTFDALIELATLQNGERRAPGAVQ